MLGRMIKRRLEQDTSCQVNIGFDTAGGFTIDLVHMDEQVLLAGLHCVRAMYA